MAPRKQKHWNILAAISILLAAVLAVSGISELDVGGVPSRDSLRLASSSRALTTNTRRLPADGWTSLRGQVLSDRETNTDQKALEEAPFHIQAGVYATSTYDLDLSIPSYSANGYVWLRWDEAVQDYLEEQGQSISERITLVNALLSDADPVLTPLAKQPVRQPDGSYYQLFTYIGRFYIDKASFRHFPVSYTHLTLPTNREV